MRGQKGVSLRNGDAVVLALVYNQFTAKSKLTSNAVIEFQKLMVEYPAVLELFLMNSASAIAGSDSNSDLRILTLLAKSLKAEEEETE